MANPSSQSVQSTDAVPRALPPPLYGGVVVALAIFFIGLALLTPPIDRYVVSAEIATDSGTLARQAVGKETYGTDTSARQLDSQQIAAAARAAFFRASTSRHRGLIPQLSSGRLHDIVDRVGIKIAESDQQQRHIIVSFDDQDLRWAKAFVDHLAQQLVSNWNEASRTTSTDKEAIRKAEWHVQQARHYERKARFDMESSLNAHVEQLRRDGHLALAGGSRYSRSVGGSEASQVTVEAALKENPQWDRLRAELESLKAELQSALVSLRSNPSQTQEMSGRMEQLQRQLSATLQYLPPGPATGNASAIQSAPINDESRTPRPVTHAMAAASKDDDRETKSVVPTQYQQLRQQYAQAVRRREAAERALSEVEAAGTSKAGRSSANTARIVRPAVLAEQLGGVPPVGPVLTLTTLALFCGAFVSGWAKTLGRIPRIYSARDLQTATALPLVGRVSIAPMPARRRRRAYWGVAVRWSVHAGELILLALILMFSWSVLRESPALEQMATNPLGTIASRLSEVVAR
ncbi:MAG: hypothetical protein ACODAD_13920 [Planctomycetota bacterium]